MVERRKTERSSCCLDAEVRIDPSLAYIRLGRLYLGDIIGGKDLRKNLPLLVIRD